MPLEAIIPRSDLGAFHPFFKKREKHRRKLSLCSWADLASLRNITMGVWSTLPALVEGAGLQTPKP